MRSERQGQAGGDVQGAMMGHAGHTQVCPKGWVQTWHGEGPEEGGPG